MRILIVHRYYAPDVGAYPCMLKIMARHFVDCGHQVTVFSTQPGYNNVVSAKLPVRMIADGVEEIRIGIFPEDKKNFFVRITNVLLFIFRIVLHCLVRFRRYDLITVGSFPPTVTAMAVRWMAWINNCQYLYHCQDIYPEIAAANGLIKRKWLATWALNIDRRNCRNAAAVVTLSNDMAKTLTARKLPGANIKIINNFVIDHFDPSIEIDESLRTTSGKFRILFAGNLGRFQNLDQLLMAAENLKDETGIQFYFVGAGVMESELKQRAAHCGILNQTVFFRPFQPQKAIMRMINDAELAVVSLSPGVIDCAYPSKTMTYLEAGCRIMAVLEPDSELAQLVVENDIGIVSESMSAEGISAAIRTEYSRWNQSGYGRKQIQRIGNQLFGQKAILQKWSDLLNQLSSLKTVGGSR